MMSAQAQGRSIRPIRFYNFERPHRGYRTKGQTPGTIFFGRQPEILHQMGADDDGRHAA